ncbi:hypothetical protein D3C78_1528030 [compost metagenome]
MLTPLAESAAAVAARQSRPSMKSVSSAGSSNGLQRRRLGVIGPSSPPLIWRGRRSYRGCAADGRMRYIQVRRDSPRGTVKAVPESSSVYRP